MYPMEKHIPHIVYNTKNTIPELETKLTEKFSEKSKCPKKEDALSHQSTEIIRIHSPHYLNNLDRHPSTMLAAINNTFRMSLYPNAYSKTYLPPMLDNVSTTFAATECVIAVNNISQHKPNYAISLAEAYSFAGHNQGNNGDVYAPIPIAAAYALEEHNDSIQRILVIDENITVNTAEYYVKHGNGSIFFPDNNPELSALFSNKIITHNQIPDELWDFLNNPQNKIDLAFYNINIDDIEPIDSLKPADTKERERTIISLLYHFIPTVFILSGDKHTYQNATCSIIEYIAAKAEKFSSFKKNDLPYNVTPLPLHNLKTTFLQSQPSSVPSNNTHQEWEQAKEEFLQSAERLIAYLEKKYPLPIPIPSSTHNLHNYSRYSQSSSSSLSDLEQERQRLKRKLGLYNSSSTSNNDYESEEISSASTDANGNDSLSYSECIEYSCDEQ